MGTPLEDVTIETPPVGEPPEAAVVADDAVPEGVEVKDGRVDASVLAQVRRETREKAERRVREQEVEPLKRQSEDIAELKRQNQELYDYLRAQQAGPAPAPQPMDARISDEEALAEARDLELFDPQTQQPDIARAKRIIARRRLESEQTAAAVAQRFLAPVTQESLKQAAVQQFVITASLRDPDNKPLVDPEELAKVWAGVPAEVTAHPAGARTVLENVVGRAALARLQGRVASPEREPAFSEPAGGRPTAPFAMGEQEKKMARAAGLTDKQYMDGAKGFNPTGPNVIGE